MNSNQLSIGHSEVILKTDGKLSTVDKYRTLPVFDSSDGVLDENVHLEDEDIPSELIFD